MQAVERGLSIRGKTQGDNRGRPVGTHVGTCAQLSRPSSPSSLHAMAEMVVVRRRFHQCLRIIISVIFINTLDCGFANVQHVYISQSTAMRSLSQWHSRTQLPVHCVMTAA